jgi:hypothetical protein
MKEFKELPKWVQKIFLNEQFEAGNLMDEKVFINKITRSRRVGGVYWTESSKGDLHTEFLQAIGGNYAPLAEAYGIKIDKDGNEVSNACEAQEWFDEQMVILRQNLKDKTEKIMNSNTKYIQATIGENPIIVPIIPFLTLDKKIEETECHSIRFSKTLQDVYRDKEIEACEKLLSELKAEKAKEGMAKDGEMCLVFDPLNFNKDSCLRYSDGKGEFYLNGKKSGETYEWPHSVRITVHADDLYKLND